MSNSVGMFPSCCQPLKKTSACLWPKRALLADLKLTVRVAPMEYIAVIATVLRLPPEVTQFQNSALNCTNTVMVANLSFFFQLIDTLILRKTLGIVFTHPIAASKTGLESDGNVSQT